MNIEDGWVKPTLKDFLEAIPGNYSYFVLGSLALLSYTSGIYSRQIRDIDIVGDCSNIALISESLRKKGYIQSTFIDARFPGSRTLRKQGSNKYLRFEKENKALEIMTSDINKHKQEVNTELYPGLSISIPRDGVQNTEFDGLRFRALSPETLYCVYRVGLKTWGKLVKTRLEQRQKDLAALSSVINADNLRHISEHVYLHLGSLKFKLPPQLIVG